MHSRRSFLATAATGAAASIAGCGVLDSRGGSSILGERWLTEEVGRMGLPQDGEPRIDGVLVTSPSRATDLDSLSEEILDDFFQYAIVDGVPDADVEHTVASQNPFLSAAVGDFSASAAESFVSDDASEVETDRDATIHLGEAVQNRPLTGYATGAGVRIEYRGLPDEDRVVSNLETILSVADGAGESILDDEPAARLADHLEDGIYGVYNDVESDAPWGYTLAVTGRFLRRRVVQVLEDEAAAERSRLLDPAYQSSMEARNYWYVDEEPVPFDSYEVDRDGRVVETEATLPIERARAHDFADPLRISLE